MIQRQSGHRNLWQIWLAWGRPFLCPVEKLVCICRISPDIWAVIFADGSKGVCPAINLQYLQRIRRPDIWFCWRVYGMMITHNSRACNANKARDGGVLKHL